MAELGLSEVREFAERIDAGPAGRRTPFSRALYGDLVHFSDFVAIIAASVGVAEIYHLYIRGIEYD